MSIYNLSIGDSRKRPYTPPLEALNQTPKKPRLGEGPENSAALQVELLHPPGLNELASAATMDDREEKLVTVICNFGTQLLENRPDVASAKFVEAELAKISSTDPRIDILRKKILEIKASNTCEPPVPNGLSSAQPPQTSPINKKVSELLSSGNMLAQQAKLLSVPARLTKLKEAQYKLIEALNVEPSNAFALRSLKKVLELQLAIDPENASALRYLGNVLRLQALPLSGPARSTKLKEAYSKLQASLTVEKENAFALHSLEKVLELQLAIDPENAFALSSLGNVLLLQAVSLFGPARLTKLDEAQDKLDASLKIEPNNAFALSSLGNVLLLQAELLSDPACSSKLKEAQDKLQASLKIEPNNAFALRYLKSVKADLRVFT